MASIFPRWKLALERFGWRGCWDQMFAMGTVKIGGVKIGEDVHGNTYWEDRNEKHCQHRWVQYKNTWDFDAAMVPPSWHGWLCHMTDEPGPNSAAFLEDKLKSVAQLDTHDDGPYTSHLGRSPYKEEEHWMTNETQLRNRGYGIGSMLKPDPNEPDKYYKQPGSETSGQAGEYARRKGYEPWDPSDAALIIKKGQRAVVGCQYHADKKYKEAVAEAVEACADDTKGQNCYICTQALHWKTKEGLVRGCSCRGTAGFAHVSCLAEQAKILVEEGEDNNLGLKAMTERFERWYTCSLCEQDYHGVVACALGWACWKTYVGQPEADRFRRLAMSGLGIVLSAADHHDDALSVKEAELSMKRRLGASEHSMLAARSNLAGSYQALGRHERALQIQRDVYSGYLRLEGEEYRNTHVAANNYAVTLARLQHLEEARALFRKTIPSTRRVLGENDGLTLEMTANYAKTLGGREAVTILEKLAPTARRVLGGAHPLAMNIEETLRCAQADLRAREE
ncbi:unnamed protein product [Pelagomonas calceolata]|uniref:RING-CH-type domain-containing protein n=1 Tax=Pelagomonas calceolata TaxID=35677 RepID=A0A8J2T2M7_9STRA|nr:unnamed protein product [Pelagomonas calceolata]